MKKIFLLAISLPFIVCSGFAETVENFGDKVVDTAHTLGTPDHENYWLNNIRTFKTYPISYYQKENSYSAPTYENNVYHTREYPRNSAISARVGQVMLSDETYTVRSANLGQHYEVSADGTVYNSTDEIKLDKGQVITPLGEVKINGHYYLVFEPERDGRLLLADTQGQIMHNIGRYYRGDFLSSKDVTSVLPKDLSIVKSDDIKQEASDMAMQFEIKYAGLDDGLMHFLYVDYSNGRTETKLTFSKEQKFIDIEGMHIQILDASADEVQYILRN